MNEWMNECFLEIQALAIESVIILFKEQVRLIDVARKN